MLQAATQPSKYHGRTTQNYLKKEFYREKETAACSSHRRCAFWRAVQPTEFAGRRKPQPGLPESRDV